MILVLLLNFQFNTSLSQNYSEAIYDLKEADFDSAFVSLAGSWEFYYDELLSPNELSTKSPKDYLLVPKSWHSQEEFPLLGKATYRCQTIMPASYHGLLLYISMITSSSKIWVNGELRSTSGLISEDGDTYKAQLTNNYVPLPDGKDTLEIVIQVANHTYFSSGLLGTPIIGNTAAIIKEKTLRNGIENVFAGSLIAIFIYQLFLFFLYNRGKPNLWLALICLVVALRSMILNGGSFLLPSIFPLVSFEIWKKIEFGGIYLIVALFPLYVHHLFETSSSKITVKVFVASSILLILPVIFTDQHVYGQLLDVSHIALIAAFIFAIYTIAKAWLKQENPDALYIFLGIIASFPFILLEILKNTALIDFNIRFGYLVETGLLVFLIFQVYMLANHYANSFKSLEVIKLELEAKVNERTSDLQNSNKIKDRLLSVISHDVKSPLNNLRGLLSLYHSKSITQEKLSNFIKQIDDSLSRTNGMVDNILFWTTRQRKGVKVKIEKIDVVQILRDIIMLMKNPAEIKSINIEYEAEGPIKIDSDEGIVNFVIRNLLANAVKFSTQNGEINVKLEQNTSNIKLTVVDHGVGMTDEQIARLFESERAESTQGTAEEKGTGLGLNLVKEYLQEINGELAITSKIGLGSIFEVTIPNSQ
ncbi:MAG: sensor histidine kinase [Reichenbachiella sp.]|uniref:sensor histidine kinase n=1 Tax=Reichenbachiella sp. TaxID=2184521 RepID=UPI0032679786